MSAESGNVVLTPRTINAIQQHCVSEAEHRALTRHVEALRLELDSLRTSKVPIEVEERQTPQWGVPIEVQEQQTPQWGIPDATLPMIGPRSSTTAGNDNGLRSHRSLPDDGTETVCSVSPRVEEPVSISLHCSLRADICGSTNLSPLVKVSSVTAAKLQRQLEAEVCQLRSNLQGSAPQLRSDFDEALERLEVAALNQELRLVTALKNSLDCRPSVAPIDCSAQQPTERGYTVPEQHPVSKSEDDRHHSGVKWQREQDQRIQRLIQHHMDPSSPHGATSDPQSDLAQTLPGDSWSHAEPSVVTTCTVTPCDEASTSHTQHAPQVPPCEQVSTSDTEQVTSNTLPALQEIQLNKIERTPALHDVLAQFPLQVGDAHFTSSSSLSFSEPCSAVQVLQDALKQSPRQDAHVAATDVHVPLQDAPLQGSDAHVTPSDAQVTCSSEPPLPEPFSDRPTNFVLEGDSPCKTSETPKVDVGVTVVQMSIENVDFQKLDQKAKGDLQLGLRRTIAANSGVAEDLVSVELHPGSVQVIAKVNAPHGHKLNIDTSSLSQDVLRTAKSIDGIREAAVGELSVTQPTIQQVVFEQNHDALDQNDVFVWTSPAADGSSGVVAAEGNTMAQQGVFVEGETENPVLTLGTEIDGQIVHQHEQDEQHHHGHPDQDSPPQTLAQRGRSNSGFSLGSMMSNLTISDAPQKNGLRSPTPRSIPLEDSPPSPPPAPVAPLPPPSTPPSLPPAPEETIRVEESTLAQQGIYDIVSQPQDQPEQVTLAPDELQLMNWLHVRGSLGTPRSQSAITLGSYVSGLTIASEITDKDYFCGVTSRSLPPDEVDDEDADGMSWSWPSDAEDADDPDLLSSQPIATDHNAMENSAMATRRTTTDDDLRSLMGTLKPSELGVASKSQGLTDMVAMFPRHQAEPEPENSIEATKFEYDSSISLCSSEFSLN